MGEGQGVARSSRPAPAYTTKKGRMYQGDCLEILKQYPVSRQRGKVHLLFRLLFSQESVSSLVFPLRKWLNPVFQSPFRRRGLLNLVSGPRGLCAGR